ncbi:MAG: flavin reductase family protein [Bacteroidota bacterium]
MTTTFKTIDPTQLPTNEVYQHLSTAVAPRPIGFASTIDKAGDVNLSPFSFFNVFSANPSILVFSPVKSSRTNQHKDTFLNVQKVPEVVINIVNYAMVEQMSLASTAYEKGVNEFVKSGFTQVPSDVVRPPRVGESPISFECTVEQIIQLGNGPGSGNLVVAKVVRMHLNEAFLDTNGQLDTLKMDLVGRMGGSWYCRMTPEALFEIPKPIRRKGIGVDQLPESIRQSSVLTGNNLGRLGNVEKLPSGIDFEVLINREIFQSILNDSHTNKPQKVNQWHRLAQQKLENGQTDLALQYLLLCDWWSIQN